MKSIMRFLGTAAAVVGVFTIVGVVDAIVNKREFSLKVESGDPAEDAETDPEAAAEAAAAYAEGEAKQAAEENKPETEKAEPAAEAKPAEVAPEASSEE